MTGKSGCDQDEAVRVSLVGPGIGRVTRRTVVLTGAHGLTAWACAVGVAVSFGSNGGAR